MIPHYILKLTPTPSVVIALIPHQKLFFTTKVDHDGKLQLVIMQRSMDHGDPIASGYYCNTTSVPKVQRTSWKRAERQKGQRTERSAVRLCLLEMTWKLLMIPQQYGFLNKN